MSVIAGDFRSFECPPTDVILVDPPYGIGKVYAGEKEEHTFLYWVDALVKWAEGKYGWLLILGPYPTMRDWLHRVPEPADMIMWHRTFLLPKKGKAQEWADSLTPILVYRSGGVWYGGGRRNERTEHDVIDAHSSMGDVGRLRKFGIRPEGHPAITGTSLPAKILPFISKPGDTLLDPMAGIGSILVAGQRFGLQATGYEINSDWAALANKWLAAEHCLKNQITP